MRERKALVPGSWCATTWLAAVLLAAAGFAQGCGNSVPPAAKTPPPRQDPAPRQESASRHAPPARPDEAAVRRVCLESLKEIERGVTALIDKHPDSLGHLGPGALDEKELRLRFPVRDPQRRIRESPVGRNPGLPPPGTDGLIFRYTIGPEPLTASLAFTRVGFSKQWCWVGSFSESFQQEVGEVAVRAARPVLDIENATIAADLAGRGPGAYVLRGGPGLTLTTALAEKPELDGPVVELYETNTSDKTIAVGPGYAQLMRDGQTVSQSTSLSTAFFVPLLGSDKNPFVYLKPGEKRKVGSAVLGTRSPGDYRVRAAWCHDGDGWLDVTPTYCDGSPVYRKVEGAWTGVLVSNELSVAVPASPAGR